MTFGQPRIGNAAFASYYSKRVPNTIRVTNGHDIVPHLPPYYRYFPQKTYRHFPREASSFAATQYLYCLLLNCISLTMSLGAQRLQGTRQLCSFT